MIKKKNMDLNGSELHSCGGIDTFYNGRKNLDSGNRYYTKVSLL